MCLHRFTRTASICSVLAALSTMQLARAADDPVTLIARIYASPGREAELESRLQKFADFVHKAEPTATYFFLRSNKTPGLYMSYEIYPSKAAADEHVKVTLPAAAQAVGPAAEGLLARPMEAETWTPFTN